MKPFGFLVGALLAAYLCCADAQVTSPGSVLPRPTEGGGLGDRVDPMRGRSPGSSPMLDINIDGEGISLPRGVEDRRPELEPRRIPTPPAATTAGPGATPPKPESR